MRRDPNAILGLAALVERLGPETATLTLVNVNPLEHHEVNHAGEGPLLAVRLEPGVQEPADLGPPGPPLAGAGPET
jgi:hypothetical protein